MDWKHNYPAHLHRKAHERARRAAHWSAGILAVVALAYGIYSAGINRGATEERAAAASEAPLLRASGGFAACPPSDEQTDVLEHAWVHRGVLIYRECVRVARPGPLALRPQMQTPALFKRAYQ